jgi:hypothetical protein
VRVIPFTISKKPTHMDHVNGYAPQWVRYYADFDAWRDAVFALGGSKYGSERLGKLCTEKREYAQRLTEKHRNDPNVCGPAHCGFTIWGDELLV